MTPLRRFFDAVDCHKDILRFIINLILTTYFYILLIIFTDNMQIYVKIFKFPSHKQFFLQGT